MEQLELFTRAELRAGVRLTDRDMAALGWLVEQRAATLPQVAELLGRLGDGPMTERRVRQVVARWEQVGVAKRWSIWHGEPPVVCPTATAARMHGVERFRRPSVGLMRHTVAVSGVRLLIERPGSNRTWIAESTLHRICAPGEHIADGGWTQPEGSTAVEVELTPHGRARVEAAIRSLLAAHDNGRPRWNAVLYMCAPPTLAQVTAVATALEEPLRSSVTVRPLP